MESGTLVSVAVRAQDPVLRAGLVGLLASDPTLELHSGPRPADVRLCAVDVVDREVIRSLAVDSSLGGSVVLVATTLDGPAVSEGLRGGVRGFLRRVDAGQLSTVVGVVAGGGTYVPSDLVPDVVGGVGPSLGSSSCPAEALDTRELAVLRLIAEGVETSDIATELAYSERTIKSIVHGIVSRLQLRNRTHAVAWALRNGQI
jgi:DNA-binding NarL/FixJ family response regulator